MPAPVPADTVRVNIVWVLPQNEIAVNTLHFQHLHVAANTLDWEGDMTQRYADLVIDGLKSTWSNWQALLSSTVSIQRADAYHLGTDGKTLHKKTCVATGARLLVGSAASQMLPPLCAAAVSLYGYNPTAFDAQSSRKRGRIYIPGLSVTNMSGGRHTAKDGLSAQLAGAFSYMQNRKMDASAGLNERAQLVINSRKFTQNSPVTHVRVDDLVDVQRRRQNAWVPAITTTAISPQT